MDQNTKVTNMTNSILQWPLIKMQVAKFWHSIKKNIHNYLKGLLKYSVSFQLNLREVRFSSSASTKQHIKIDGVQK